MIKGKVKFFNKDKGFGRIVAELNGQVTEVFFHIYNRRAAVIGECGVTFGGKRFMERAITVQGETIFFELGPADNASMPDQAKPWMHAEDYYRAVRTMAQLPVYRITTKEDEAIKELWMGSDIRSLLEEDGENPFDLKSMTIEVMTAEGWLKVG